MIEVKSPATTYYEAQVQATEATVATINNLLDVQKQIMKRGVKYDGIDMLPFPFITVVGHEWSLHWIYHRDSRDGGRPKMDVIGPCSLGGTQDRTNAFKPMNSIQKLKTWMGSEYSGWVKRWQIGRAHV